MTETKKQLPPKPRMSSTKKEMLDAYDALLNQLQEQQEAALRPEKKAEEKRTREVVKAAESLLSEGVVKGINNLKFDISKMLTEVSDKLEEEVNKLDVIRKAITVKEEELKELYEIEKSAGTLAALIEAQNRKRQEFENEMVAMKETLMKEVENTRSKWEKEKEQHEAEIKEQQAAEKKKREREKEEFQYAFEREQQLFRDEFEDKKKKLEREIEIKREQMERELKERERAISEKEGEIAELQKQVSAFPRELEAAVNKAVKEATERITKETAAKEQLLRKEFEGERKVFISRIEALEKTVDVQAEQVVKLSAQLEKSYQKVEDIAVKAIEGSSNLKSLSNLQQMMMSSQVKKQE